MAVFVIRITGAGTLILAVAGLVASVALDWEALRAVPWGLLGKQIGLALFLVIGGLIGVVQLMTDADQEGA